VNESAQGADSEDSTLKPIAGIRILHVTLNSPAHNPRMLKENRTYIEAGAEVFALVVGEQRDDDLREDVDGAQLLSYRLPRVEAIRAKLSIQAWFRSGVFRAQIQRAVRETSPDVIQAHDMFVAGSVFAARTNVPVVLDLHENYPAATEQYRTAYPTVKRLLFSSFQYRGRMDRIERRYIARAATVFTVTEEATDRVRNKCPQAIVATIPNVERRDFGSDTPRATDKPIAPSNDQHPESLRIVYTGGFEVLRGLHTVVRALALLPEADSEGLDAHLDLIGARDSDYVRRLRGEVDELNLAKRVTLHEWIPREEVTARIDSADLTLVPHEANDQTNATVPHKLFQYMARGKPVLVSSCPPLAKHIHAADSGFVFTAGDERDCARAITEALDRRDDLQRLGENGRRYVTEKMNWELVSEPALIGALMNLTTGSQSATPSTSSVEA
jgi:glycosyltransferase involved in cell wall biosynthesis